MNEEERVEKLIEKIKATTENLEDYYDFVEEEFLGESNFEGEKAENHSCYDYGDFGELTFVDDIATFTRRCSECNMLSMMVYRRKEE